jgi:hypothetical protein
MRYINPEDGPGGLNWIPGPVELSPEAQAALARYLADEETDRKGPGDEWHR